VTFFFISSRDFFSFFTFVIFSSFFVLSATGAASASDSFFGSGLFASGSAYFSSFTSGSALSSSYSCGSIFSSLISSSLFCFSCGSSVFSSYLTGSYSSVSSAFFSSGLICSLGLLAFFLTFFGCFSADFFYSGASSACLFSTGFAGISYSTYFDSSV